MLAVYEDKNIYNIDETGLFCVCTRTKSLMERIEKAELGNKQKKNFNCFIFSFFVLMPLGNKK